MNLSTSRIARAKKMLRRLFPPRSARRKAYSCSNLGRLPRVLDYTGEFGAELVLFMPFCAWLSAAGLLKKRRIRTYRGMRCFYDDLDCLEIIEKDHKRTWVHARNRPRWLPVRDEHDFDNVGKPYLHLYPDLRRKFGGLALLPALDLVRKPLLVIHNKYNDEWDGGPVNHLSETTLEAIFEALSSAYTIVYIRHGMGPKYVDFSEDHNARQPFDELPLLGRHPHVLTFDGLYGTHRAQGGDQDVNTFKNVLYSRCYHFISSQGGGAHQIAMFSGSLLAILHREGDEELLAYGDGYYSFMARIPPIRAICRSDGDLLNALALFTGTTIAEDRVLVDVNKA